MMKNQYQVMMKIKFSRLNFMTNLILLVIKKVKNQNAKFDEKKEIEKVFD